MKNRDDADKLHEYLELWSYKELFTTILSATQGYTILDGLQSTFKIIYVTDLQTNSFTS